MSKFGIDFSKNAGTHNHCGGWEPSSGEDTDGDCGYGTTISCDECKYGGGRKDPEAKCNQEKDYD